MKKLIAILTLFALLTCGAFAENAVSETPDAAIVLEETPADEGSEEAAADAASTEEAAPNEADSEEEALEEEKPIDMNQLAAEEPTEAFTGAWQDPAQDRAVLKIVPAFEMDVPEDETWFDVTLEWGQDVSTQSVWYMSARFDAETLSLKYTNGAMSQITHAEDGSSVENKQWEDAEGALTLNGEGKLLWTDSREEQAANFVFEKQEQAVPDPEELGEQFVGVVAGLEKDSAGNTLKLAEATCQVVQYAYSRSLWSVDPDALCENLSTAWKALDEDARKRFDDNLMDVMDAANEAFGNYDSVKSLYEDAGAAAMGTLAESEEAMLAWETLLDCSLMMEVD